MRSKRVQTGVSVLPSLFSLTNLFFGFMSVLLTFQGRYRAAAILIIIAALMDGLDGLVARATHTPSEFGVELDSLADAVSFGLATSILLYFWGMETAGTPAVFFSFVFRDAVGLLDLARKFGAFSRNHVEVIVGELAPLGFDFALELFPVAFNDIPVHFCSFDSKADWRNCQSGSLQSARPRVFVRLGLRRSVALLVK